MADDELVFVTESCQPDETEENEESTLKTEDVNNSEIRECSDSSLRKEKKKKRSRKKIKKRKRQEDSSSDSESVDDRDAKRRWEELYYSFQKVFYENNGHYYTEGSTKFIKNYYKKYCVDNNNMKETPDYSDAIDTRTGNQPEKPASKTASPESNPVSPMKEEPASPDQVEELEDNSNDEGVPILFESSTASNQPPIIPTSPQVSNPTSINRIPGPVWHNLNGNLSDFLAAKLQPPPFIMNQRPRMFEPNQKIMSSGNLPLKNLDVASGWITPANEQYLRHSFKYPQVSPAKPPIVPYTNTPLLPSQAIPNFTSPFNAAQNYPFHPPQPNKFPVSVPPNVSGPRLHNMRPPNGANLSNHTQQMKPIWMSESARMSNALLGQSHQSTTTYDDTTRKSVVRTKQFHAQWPQRECERMSLRNAEVITKDAMQTNGATRQNISDAELPNEIVNHEKGRPSFEFVSKNVYNNESANDGVDVFSCHCNDDSTTESSANCDFSCINRILRIECSNNCAAGPACTNKQFQNARSPRLDVFNTLKTGFGLRTLDNISAGAFIVEYVGEVVSKSEVKSKLKEYRKQGMKELYTIQLSSTQVIDASKKGNFSRFMNHSCDPNCEVQKWAVNGAWRLGVFALRDVKEMEELTFDYQGRILGRKTQSVVCECSASNCRGFVGSVSSRKTSQGIAELINVVEGGTLNSSNTEKLTRFLLHCEDREERSRLLKCVLKTGTEKLFDEFARLHGCSILLFLASKTWEDKQLQRFFEALKNQSPKPNNDLVVLPLDFISTCLHVLLKLPVKSRTPSEREGVVSVVSRLLSSAPPVASLVGKIDQFTTTIKTLVEIVSMLRKLKTNCSGQASSVSIETTTPRADKRDTLDSGLHSETGAMSKTSVAKEPVSPPEENSRNQLAFSRKRRRFSSTDINAITGGDVDENSGAKRMKTSTNSGASKRRKSWTEFRDNSSEGSSFTDVFRCANERNVDLSKKSVEQVELSSLEPSNLNCSTESGELKSPVKFSLVQETISKDNNVVVRNVDEVDKEEKALMGSVVVLDESKVNSEIEVNEKETELGSRDDAELEAVTNPECAKETCEPRGNCEPTISSDVIQSSHVQSNQHQPVPLVAAATPPLVLQPGQIIFIQTTDGLVPQQVSIPFAAITPASSVSESEPATAALVRHHVAGHGSGPTTVYLASAAPTSDHTSLVLSAATLDAGDIGNTLRQNVVAFDAKDTQIQTAVAYGSSDDKQNQSNVDSATVAVSLPNADGSERNPSTMEAAQKPDKLPKNWRSAKDPSNGATYYYHAVTRQTQWHFPAANGPEDYSSSSEDDDSDVEQDGNARIEVSDSNANLYDIPDSVFDNMDSVVASHYGAAVTSQDSFNADLFDSHSIHTPPEPFSEPDNTQIGANRLFYADRSAGLKSSGTGASDVISAPIKHSTPSKQPRLLLDPYKNSASHSNKLNHIVSQSNKRHNHSTNIPHARHQKPASNRHQLPSSHGRVKAVAEHSSASKQAKEEFREKVSKVVVQTLNGYLRSDCKLGRIKSADDFKFLARKLVHFIVDKELRKTKKPERLRMTSEIANKAKTYIQSYMTSLGPEYKRHSAKSPK